MRQREGPMADKLTALEAHREGKLDLPPGYRLEYGAAVLLLRRENGSVAATFIAKTEAPAEVARIADQDYRARLANTP